MDLINKYKKIVKKKPEKLIFSKKIVSKETVQSINI